MNSDPAQNTPVANVAMKRAKRRRLKFRQLVSEDSGHSEKCPTFCLGRVNRTAHHFQSEDFKILTRAAHHMHNTLSASALKEAMKRPTMSTRTWLRRACKNYGTWREQAELSEILGGVDPSRFVTESSDDDADDDTDQDNEDSLPLSRLPAVKATPTMPSSSSQDPSTALHPPSEDSEPSLVACKFRLQDRILAQQLWNSRPLARDRYTKPTRE